MTAPGVGPPVGAECEIWELGCNAGNWVKDGVVAAFEYVGEQVVTAVGEFTATLGTFWVGFSTPAVAVEPGSATPSAPVAFVQDSLWWYVGAIAILSVIVVGTRMAITMRAQPIRELLHSLFMLVVVSGAGVAVVSLLVEATDQFSAWIIDRSTTAGFGASITALLAVGALSGISIIIMITLGLVALLASIVQIVLLIVRGGLIVVLAGILPLTVAAYSTEQGRQWFRKAASWLLAFILYKPAAAIVYATAFALVDVMNVPSEQALVQIVMGLTLMVAALFALPALMRFVTPMVGSVTGSGGGGGGGAALGLAASAMPTGSKRLGKASASGIATSTGEAGPSGAGGGNDDQSKPSRGRGPDKPGPDKTGSGKPGGGPASPGGQTPGSSSGGAGGGAAGGGGAGSAGAGAGAGGGAAGGAVAGVGAVAAATIAAGKKAGEAAAAETGPAGAKDDAGGGSSTPPPAGAKPGPSGAARADKPKPTAKRPPQSGGGGPRGSK